MCGECLCWIALEPKFTFKSHKLEDFTAHDKETPKTKMEKEKGEEKGGGKEMKKRTTAERLSPGALHFPALEPRNSAYLLPL